MPEIGTDVFQGLALLLMLVTIIVLVAVLSTLNAIRKQLDASPQATANTSAPTLERSTYDYEGSVSTYEPVQTEVPAATTEEAATGFVSLADAVSAQPEPATSSAEPVAGTVAAAGATTPGLLGDEPEEQPFERDGRWWFKRGAELLVYDEGTGQWVASAGAGSATPDTTATATFPTTTVTPVEAEAGEGWRCSSCGAINGSTATSCRMCFAPR
jgi:hypothetical protein